jgi:signal transduction histidine kinase
MLASRAAFTVSAMAGNAGDRDVRTVEVAPRQPTAGLHRVTVIIAVAAGLVATVGVATALHGRSPDVVAAAIGALLVAAVGIAFVVVGAARPVVPELVTLVLVGLSGATLAWLMPDTPGFVITYVALAGLGMRLPLGPAIAAGLGLLAVMNIGYLLTAKVPVAGLISQDIGAAFVFSVAAFTRISRIAQEQARVAQARAESLLAQLQASQAAQAEAAALTERARLAREIHDILAHALSGLVLALDTMELLGRRAETDPGLMQRMLEQVARAQRMARDGLADTKRAIAALRGDELPGPALLEPLIRDTAAATGLLAGLSVEGVKRPLSPEVGLALYRTAQEALTNTAKYAGPGAEVVLRLTYAKDAVELAVEDRRSADAPEIAAGMTFGGFGLTGMRERAELLGGSLTAGPTELGFGVRLRLPTEAAASLQVLASGPDP